ncbi:MAG: AzlC family ABC transporter permease [Rhodospirillaceae bacterium]|nr:AzlC family ABC transporter permease [Rhodospirillaceae bacterium]
MSADEKSSPSRPFEGTSSAFKGGLRDGAMMPVIMVSSAMLGFGSLARDSGLSLDVTVFLTLGLWGLPGQVAMAEMWAMSAPILAIVVASSMGNMRFLPLALVTVPWFRGDKRPKWTHFLAAQVMSINIWTIFMRQAPEIELQHRYPYFMGIGAICLVGGTTGTVLGFVLAGELPVAVTIALVFMNPAYFLFVFSSVRHRNCIIAVILGAFTGPLLHQVSPDWSVPLTGILAGTAAFLLDRATTKGDHHAAS